MAAKPKAAISISIEKIIPKNPIYDTVRLQKQVDALNVRTQKRMKAQFEKTVVNFTTKVRFIRTKTRDGVGVYANNKIYYYLVRGTSIRWAVMKEGYRPITSPVPGNAEFNRIVTRPHQRTDVFDWSTAIRGKQAMLAKGIGPRSGIKARNFHIVIANDNQIFYENAMLRILARTQV